MGFQRGAGLVEFRVLTPRNLVLLTLSTVELSMVSGGWSTAFIHIYIYTYSFRLNETNPK